MKKDFYNVIGVMSGTSLDGIDLCHVHFEKKDNWTFEIVHSKTVPYALDWHEDLKNVVHFNPSELNLFDQEYRFPVLGI